MERRLAAIFAADVVGYSRFMGEDEAGTLARLEGLKAELLDPLVGHPPGPCGPLVPYAQHCHIAQLATGRHLVRA